VHAVAASVTGFLQRPFDVLYAVRRQTFCTVKSTAFGSMSARGTQVMWP
jgi:hypothetical protein